MATWDRSVALPRAMMIDASGCNGGGGPKEEVMEAELVLSLISGGGRKRFDSSGEPLGGRISDGTSGGKDDLHPGASVAEDPTVVIAVGGEKGILREGNADSEEVGVEANGGGAAGDANERTLENGRGHREESAAVVAMDAATAENYVVGVETEMAGNDSGGTLESRPWGHVEVVQVKVSVDAQVEKNEVFSEDGKEAERQNGDCNQLQEVDSSRRVEKGDAIEAETNFGREPLNCQKIQERLVVGTAVPDMYEENEEANPVVELRQEQENDVTRIEVDDAKSSSHAAEDERSRIRKQVERESQWHPDNLVSVVDEGSLEVVCYGRQSESIYNVADVKSEIDLQGGSEPEELQAGLVPVVVDEAHCITESEPSHDAVDDKVPNQNDEHQTHLVPVMNDEECPVVDHTIDEPESSHDAADVEREIDQLAEPGSEEQQVNKLCDVGNKESQDYETFAGKSEHHGELKSVHVDTAVTELHQQADLESERKEQLNETVITVAGDQIEQVVVVEEDVNQCVDIVVTEFDHHVESELERKGQLTETVMPDTDGQLGWKQEPPTERAKQVVSHAEERESLNFVRQVNDLQEIEPAAESGMQQSCAILVDNPCSIAEVAPVAQSEEKPDLETNLIVMSTSENAFTEQAQIRSGEMVHNVSSNMFNTGHMNVPDTNLQGHSESNESRDIRPTSSSDTFVKDAKTGSGNSDVVHEFDAGVAGEVAMVIDVNRMAKDISDIHDEKSSPELEDFSGAYSEPSRVDVHSSADSSDKDGSTVESRCPESEHNYSQSSISSVTQYYHGNQFIKFGEIITNLDEAHNPKRGPFFIIRVPRFTGDELWAKIQQVQDEVDEKTNIRDLINKEVQMQKAICLRVLGELATAGFAELATREAFEAKLAELTHVASMITMLSTSHSLEEIDTQIKETEFNHQHVTGPLKEEKKYMQELKKLKCPREDMSSSMASKNEIDKALKDEDSIDQKLKDLKKELDSLRSDLAQAEAKAIVARKRYDDEDKILQNIRKQFNAANEIRQDAFSHLQHLKKESFEKNMYFHNYKNDQTTARLYASSRNKGGLWLHCRNQVEEVMSMWNNNDSFRKQYVDCNKNSVFRRLKTLDARSLGPDEKPTVPSDMHKVLSTTVPTKVTLPKTLKAKELPPATQTVQKGQPAKMRKSNVAITKATRDSSAAPLVPITELMENTEKEKSMTKEEEELARKEDEVRKEKEAAELKERLRLEQRVKAKEAEERKKKQAKKAQARAEYRAQKEAELKEKKRTKKEKKKGSDVADATQIDDKEVLLKTTESNAAETFQEQQAASSSRRNAWSTVAAKKLNSVQPVPLLLRNRRRRKIGTWTWVILTAMLVIGLFLALQLCFCL